MGDGPEPEGRTAVQSAVATGAAAFALVAGTVLIFLVFGLVLSRFGFGVLLLVAAGALLLFGAIFDLRRKRRRPAEPE